MVNINPVNNDQNSSSFKTRNASEHKNPRKFSLVPFAKENSKYAIESDRKSALKGEKKNEKKKDYDYTIDYEPYETSKNEFGVSNEQSTLSDHNIDAA